MTLNKIQAMSHHIGEIQKLIYEAQKCAPGSCKSCNYTHICAATSHLFTLITCEADRYNVKGELENDTK